MPNVHPTRRRACLALASIALVASTLQAAAPPPAGLTIDRIFAGGEFDEESVSVGPWWPKKAAYAVMERAEGKGQGKDLVRVGLADGKKEVIATARHFIPAGATTPLAIRMYAFSDDGSKLLLYTGVQKIWRRSSRGDYWIFDIATRELKRLGGDSPPSSLMNAQLSPDGTKVCYARANDLYIQDLRDLKIVRLTKDGADTILNGVFDWAYEEEFEIVEGFRWSPDSKRVAFWRLDTSEVRPFHLIDNAAGLYSKVTPIRYPKVGEKNAKVSICVVGASGGDVKRFENDAEYIPRMNWAGDSDKIAVQQLNRLQNEITITLATLPNAVRDALNTQKVLTDTDRAWVDVHDIRWVHKGKHFLWLSEKDGWRHAYLVSRDGTDKKLLTKGDYDVIRIDGWDEANDLLYFTASPTNATQAYLYRVKADGSAAERVTPAGQAGTHGYRISPDANWAIHTFSTFDRPPVTEIVSLPSHKTARVLADDKKLVAKLDGMKRPKSEFFRIDIGKCGALDAWCLEPPDLDPSKKYPVLVHVYGEPAGQTVLDRWAGKRHLWHLMLAQRGYIIVSIDNRGTSAPRGREWRKSIYRKVGILAPDDQAAALRAFLAARPYADPGRVAIWGWSGGGSMSLNAVFRHPELYQTAMSVAPVANQRYYDSIYQERYMGLPGDNAEGYRDGSPITHAHKLKGNLLLVHGTGDDNCHYQATEALVDELVARDKHFTMMAYPNRSHGISEGANTTRHLFGLLARYLERHTPPGPRARVAKASRPGGGAVAAKLAVMGLGPVGRAAAEVAGQGKSRNVNIEGWNVSIDERLLEGEHAPIGTQAVMLLRRQLQAIRLIVPADKVARLQKVTIQLDLSRGLLRSPQYHPGAGWLKENGYPESLAKCVHIPDARYFNARRFQHQQPWAVMHELAHAYHDQVLGFDDKATAAAWKRFQAGGRYESVQHIDGQKRRHYALTNPMEFFAEMTEAYFGQNDFYPFNRAELRRDEPEIFALLVKIWGKAE